MGMTKRVRNRTPSNPADIAARREAFNIVRKGMRYAHISKVTGLAINTVTAYANPVNPDQAATWASIELLREEAIQRAKTAIAAAEEEHEKIVRSANVAIADAEDRLRLAESHLQDIENIRTPTSAPSGTNPLPGSCSPHISASAFR